MQSFTEKHGNALIPLLILQAQTDIDLSGYKIRVYDSGNWVGGLW